MDVNPSLELSINRFDKVISVTFYNDDAAALIEAESLMGLLYQQAIDMLFPCDSMQAYLKNNDYLDFAVYSSGYDRSVVEYLDSYVQTINDYIPKSKANVPAPTARLYPPRTVIRCQLGNMLRF